jgi:hypothetical protein
MYFKREREKKKNQLKIANRWKNLLDIQKYLSDRSYSELFIPTAQNLISCNLLDLFEFLFVCLFYFLVSQPGARRGI